jgi:hypothetical protein
VLVLVATGVGLAQVAVVPRAVGVLLFDNNTGVTAQKLSIIFSTGPVSIAASDVIAWGGGPATLVACSNNYVFVDIVVVPGGTVQIPLAGVPQGATVTAAYWFE